MITTTVLGIISVFFAWLESSGHNKNGLKISFSFIFIFLALRYNFGNDYKSYYSGFLEISRPATIDFFDKFYRVEIGWILLNRLFKPFGFFALIATLSLLTSLVYYRVIKKYAPVKYYWFAVFLFIFTPNFLLIQLSAIRQAIAIELFLLSIPYLYKKDPIRYFILIGIGALFHTSALILLPLFFINLKAWKFNYFTILFVSVLFTSLFLFGNLITPFIHDFIYNYFKQYSVYDTKDIVSSNIGIGVFFSIGLLALLMYYERAQVGITGLFFKIAIISFIFIPLNLVLNMVSRIGMYFSPAIILAYPFIVMSIKRPGYKLLFILSISFFTLYQFFTFFSLDVWKNAYETYHTIFSS